MRFLPEGHVPPPEEMTTPVTHVSRRIIPAQPRAKLFGVIPRRPTPEALVEAVWPTEYHYQISNVRPYRTTTGQVGHLPDIAYRAYAYGSDDKRTLYDGSAPSVPREMVTPEQRQAIALAHSLEEQRRNQDPDRSVFSHLRRVEIDNSGLLYVAAPEEGKGMDRVEPYAAAKAVEQLAIVDFATIYNEGTNRKFFRYDQADITHFVPEEAENANSYAFIDDQRLVYPQEEFVYRGRGSEQGPEAQVGKIMLLNVETDMRFPVRDINVHHEFGA